MEHFSDQLGWSGSRCLFIVLVFFFIFCGSLPELLFACIFFLYHTFQIHNNDSLIAAVYLFYQIERPFPGEKWSLNKSFSILVHVTAISLFGWLVDLVNDCKFLTGTVFFSHTKPTSNNNPRSSHEPANHPNRLYIRCKLSNKSAESDPVLATFQT